MKTLSTIRLDPDVPLEVWPDFPETEISSGTRASIGYRWLDDTTNGLVAGVWEAEANLGRWMNWPVHEFMVIVEGEVVMVEEDRETVVGPGECFIIPKGRRCIWNQSGYVKKLMVIFDDRSGGPADGAQPIIKIDPRMTLTPHNYFADPTGQLTLKLQELTGDQRAPTPTRGHEVVYMLEGTVTLTDDAGETDTFGPGDTFLVPMGTSNSWQSEGSVRLISCMFQPLSDQ